MSPFCFLLSFSINVLNNMIVTGDIEKKGRWFSKQLNSKHKEKEHVYLAQGHRNVKIESVNFDTRVAEFKSRFLLIMQNLGKVP